MRGEGAASPAGGKGGRQGMASRAGPGILPSAAPAPQRGGPGTRPWVGGSPAGRSGFPGAVAASRAGAAGSAGSKLRVSPPRSGAERRSPWAGDGDTPGSSDVARGRAGPAPAWRLVPVSSPAGARPAAAAGGLRGCGLEGRGLSEIPAQSNIPALAGRLRRSAFEEQPRSPRSGKGASDAGRPGRGSGDGRRGSRQRLPEDLLGAQPLALISSLNYLFGFFF